MGECFRCGADMNTSNGCTDDRVIEFADGTERDPIPFERDDQPGGARPCHDCGAYPGNYHHPGCDMERCPRCNGQYFICDCETDEKRELWGGA